MAEVRIETYVEDFESGINAWIDEMDRASENVLDDLAEIGRDAAIAAAPSGSYHSSSHHHDADRPPLAEGVHYEVSPPELRIWIEDVNLLSLDQGSAPHEIHGNPMLRFYWENAGVPFKGPMVNHPGTLAYNFMEAAFDAMDAAAEEILDRYYL